MVLQLIVCFVKAASPFSEESNTKLGPGPEDCEPQG